FLLQAYCDHRSLHSFLHDALPICNGTMACAACHIDAEMDLIAWDLGDPTGQLQTNTTVLLGVTNASVFHPMKGPMTTQTLRGLRSEEHTSELQSRGHLVCRLLLEK